MRPRWPTYLVVFAATAAIPVIAAQAMRAQQVRREIARLKLALETQRGGWSIAPVSTVRREAENPDEKRLRVELLGQIEDLQARTGNLSARLAVHVQPVPERNWKNVGRDSAGSVMQTALWASKEADISALTETLAMNEYVLAKAGRHFNKLPKSERDAFGSAARMVAALASSEIPNDHAQVTVLDHASNQTEARVEYAEGTTKKIVTLKLQRQADGWRILVPEHVIDRYVRLLSEREPAS